MHYIIYYGSYLVFPFMCGAIYLCVRARKVGNRRLLASGLVAILLSGLFVYSRFIEPNIITVKYSSQTKVGINKKVALIADMHLGVYNNSTIMERIIEKINAQNIDAVLIAGDFTYEPSNIKKDYESLKNISVPVYAILGNHDLQHPGPNIRSELESVLTEYGVVIINNKHVDFGDGILVGLGDEFAGEDDVNYLDRVAKESDKPIVILTHNPDTTLKYSPDLITKEKWVTLSGHTHCGQLRVPFLYKLAIDGVVDGQWYNGGYYDLGGNSTGAVNKVYITCGTGEVGLPMRLFNPPVVDILEL